LQFFSTTNLASCIPIYLFNYTFWTAEYYFATVLSLILYYNIKFLNPSKPQIPGEKYILVVGWIFSLIIGLISVSTQISNKSCDPTLARIITEFLFWITTLIHTTIFIFIIYTLKSRKELSGQFSFGFYVLVFISFGYLRAPYFTQEAITLVNGTNFMSGNLKTAYILFLILANINGAIISISFSYNLGYYRLVVNKMKNYVKNRNVKKTIIEEKTIVEESNLKNN